MPTTITSDGIEIFYEEMGQGEPALLLMTAWCMSHSLYRHLLPKCAEHRRTLTLDWRGHGRSQVPQADFGAEGLSKDALAVIEASGVQQVIPVSASHSGWITVELRRILGDRVPKVINTDWLILPPPKPYMDLVHALSMPETWEQARATLFDIWLQGVDNPEVISFVREEMASYGADTWLRSGRVIGANYAAGGYPLQTLSSMRPNIPVMHLYSQPPDDDYLQAQLDFAATNPWFHVHRLAAHSHFPTLEVADEIAEVIEQFVVT